MTYIKYIWHAKYFVNVNDMTMLLTGQFLQICDVQMHIQQHIRISFLTCSNSTMALVCQGFLILLIGSLVRQEGCLRPLVVQALQPMNTFHFL